jgi:hypothetical protein
MRPNLALSLYAALCALGFGIVQVAGPGGHLLISTPSIEKVVPDPSMRLGSAHGRPWYSTGGGYHGGK